MITLDVTITVDAELLYAWIVAWRHANPAHRDWGDEAIIKQALPDAVCQLLGAGTRLAVFWYWVSESNKTLVVWGGLHVGPRRLGDAGREEAAMTSATARALVRNANAVSHALHIVGTVENAADWRLALQEVQASHRALMATLDRESFDDAPVGYVLFLSPHDPKGGAA
jgi:hypothetical protein